MKMGSRIVAAALALVLACAISAAPMTVVIMDPLSKELACACVKGHGQRDYRKIIPRLEGVLKQKVAIEFSDDLAETLKVIGTAGDIIVVGDRSLVAAGAGSAAIKVHAICELSDPEGNTTETASFIVRRSDPAKTLQDIPGRKLIFGLPKDDEKFADSVAALRAAGIEAPKENKHVGFTDAALDVLDSSSAPPPVAIVPSYGVPLIEGCGSVRPGSFKVIGKSRPSAFITVFVSDGMPAQKEEKVLKALLECKSDAKLLNALESRDGFKPIQASIPAKPVSLDWPDWRGPKRDGHVPRLPKRLPAKANIVWKKGVMDRSLAGLSVSAGKVISAERDFADENDVYRCFDANTGELAWRITFPARGNLDYGQSPRAAPVVHGGDVYLLSAFGDLRCVELSTGKVRWQRQLLREFHAALPTWGMCSTPLVVDDLLIVNPGATNASLAALELATGRTRWMSPGRPAAYSAFVCANLGGQKQIVGYDEKTLGGWEVATGKRLWTLTPPVNGDFNVPTPVAVENAILLATENNGTRLHPFNGNGQIVLKPAAQSSELAPDTTTPVVSNGRIFGAKSNRLICLDLGTLRVIWEREEEAFGDHATLIADDERALMITLAGELVLIDAKADHCEILSRLKLFEGDVEVYSHPALVGTRLFARGGTSLLCVELGDESI